MNMKNCFLSLLALLAAAALTGCGDNAAPTANTPPPAPITPPKPADLPKPPPAPPAPAAPAPAPAKPATNAPAAVIDAAKLDAENLAKSAQKAATNAMAEAQKRFGDWLGDVQKLAAEGKTAEAIQKIQNIQTLFSDTKPTADQQKAIDDVKTKLQESLSKKATDAAAQKLTDFLNKPKTGN
jgi:predicted small lipoprotein YifL